MESPKTRKANALQALKSKLLVDKSSTGDIFDFRKPLVVGLTVILLTFGVFGTWAALAPIESAAVAQGVVAVSGNRKTIQHYEGGIVKQLHVKEGDSVQAGDVLLVLDDTQAKAQLDINISQYFIGLATEARLLAERNGDLEIRYADELFTDDPRAIEAITSQERVFQARQDALQGEEDLLEQKINQLQSRVKGVEAIVKGKRELLKSYEEELKDYNKLYKSGFSDKVRLRELHRSRSTLLSEISELEAEAITTSLQIDETTLKKLQVRKNFRSSVVDQLGDVKSKIFDLDEKIRALKDRVARTEIIAPVSGIVLDLAVHTIGGVVREGEPIMDIVPATDDLIVEAKISPGDIDRVFVGQLTDIRFSSFNQRTTPVIQGKLVRVSPDALMDQQTGQNYYSARVEVTEKGFDMLGELKLQPGMPTNVFINTGARTLLEYVLRPLSDGLAKSMTDS